MSAVESKGGKQKVCRALAERDEKIIKAKDAEFATERKEKDELLAKKDSELATKDAEIAELKRQLAEARK